MHDAKGSSESKAANPKGWLRASASSGGFTSNGCLQALTSRPAEGVGCFAKNKEKKKKMLEIYRRHVPSRKRYLTPARAPVVVNEWLVQGGACCGLLYCGVGASAVHMWARAHQCGRRCVPWGPHSLHGAPRRTCRACNVYCPATKLRHFLPPSSLHQHSQPATAQPAATSPGQPQLAPSEAHTLSMSSAH